MNPWDMLGTFMGWVLLIVIVVIVVVLAAGGFVGVVRGIQKWFPRKQK